MRPADEPAAAPAVAGEPEEEGRVHGMDGCLGGGEDSTSSAAHDAVSELGGPRRTYGSGRGDHGSEDGSSYDAEFCFQPEERTARAPSVSHMRTLVTLRESRAANFDERPRVSLDELASCQCDDYPANARIPWSEQKFSDAGESGGGGTTRSPRSRSLNAAVAPIAAHGSGRFEVHASAPMFPGSKPSSRHVSMSGIKGDWNAGPLLADGAPDFAKLRIRGPAGMAHRRIASLESGLGTPVAGTTVARDNFTLLHPDIAQNLHMQSEAQIQTSSTMPRLQHASTLAMDTAASECGSTVDTGAEDAAIKARMCMSVFRKRLRNACLQTKVFFSGSLDTPRVWLAPLLVTVLLLVVLEVAVWQSAEGVSSSSKDSSQFMLASMASHIEEHVLRLAALLLELQRTVLLVPDVQGINAKWARTTVPLMDALTGGLMLQAAMSPLGAVSTVFPWDQQNMLDRINDVGFVSPEYSVYASSLPTGSVSLITRTYEAAGSRQDGNQAVTLTMSIFIPGDGTEAFGMEYRSELPYAPGYFTGSGQVAPGGSPIERSQLDPASPAAKFLKRCGDHCGRRVDAGGSNLSFWGHCSATFSLAHIFGALDKLAPLNQFSLAAVNAAGQNSSGTPAAEASLLYPPGGAGIPASESPQCQIINVLDAQWELCTVSVEGWYPVWRVPLTVCVAVFSPALGFLLFVVLLLLEKHRNMVRAVLPRKVVHQLRLGRTYAETFTQTTVLFSDIVSYTALSSELEPLEVVELLRELFSEFDRLTDKYGLYKAGTIGDAYIAVGGAPAPCHPCDAAARIAHMALDMVEFVGGRTFQQGRKTHGIQIRVGINSGDLMAAVVSAKSPVMTIIGDTVNVSSRMESYAEAMHIHVSETTAVLLRGNPDFKLTPRGVINIKGKGSMSTYYVERAGASPWIEVLMGTSSLAVLESEGSETVSNVRGLQRKCAALLQ